MDKALRNIFKHGHPCENCLTKTMCKISVGEYDPSCDYPEKYGYWLFDQEIKQIKKLERLALKGNVDAIKKMADSAIENLKVIKKWRREESKLMKTIFKN